MAGSADPGKMLMRSPVLAWPPSSGGVTTMSAWTTSPFDRFHGERAAARSRGAQRAGALRGESACALPFAVPTLCSGILLVPRQAGSPAVLPTEGVAHVWEGVAQVWFEWPDGDEGNDRPRNPPLDPRRSARLRSP